MLTIHLIFFFMRCLMLIGVMSLFIFAKCKKEKIDSTSNYFGYAKAEANGGLINYNKVKGTKSSTNSDSIGLSFQRWEGLILKEVISFGPLIKTLNQQQRIRKSIFGSNILTSNYGTLRDDGDVLCDYYNIYEADSLQNYIIITAYNPQTNEIKGTFRATYLIDFLRVATIGKCRLSTPDTIRIKNGEFYTKIF